MIARTWKYVIGAVLLGLPLSGCGSDRGPNAPAGGGDQPIAARAPRARLVRAVDWAGQGQWLKLDDHVHTKFSDGAHDVMEIADEARRYGCNAIAITDHGDSELQAATPQQAQAVAAARRKHPDLIILAGLEWNAPPWGGREHVTVLAPSTENEWPLLEQFKTRFDDWKKDDEKKDTDPARAVEALRWLAEQNPSDGQSFVASYNHPSRKRERSMDLVPELQRLLSAGGTLIGFEGAPGHQAAKINGAYQATVPTSDRWDPAVAVIGDAWDTLLGKGIDVWAARATSDFHNTRLDYWPGQFAATWVYVPESTAAGVLKGLRAGTFFASHGDLARQVEINVMAPDLPRPAMAGETVAVTADAEVTASLRCEVPMQDWQGQPNRLDEVELIGITRDGARSLVRQAPAESGPALVYALQVPLGGIVLRARGRRIVDGGPDLMFYTNPIRVLVQ